MDVRSSPVLSAGSDGAMVGSDSAGYSTRSSSPRESSREDYSINFKLREIFDRIVSIGGRVFSSQHQEVTYADRLQVHVRKLMDAFGPVAANSTIPGVYEDVDSDAVIVQFDINDALGFIAEELKVIPDPENGRVRDLVTSLLQLQTRLISDSKITPLTKSLFKESLDKAAQKTGLSLEIMMASTYGANHVEELRDQLNIATTIDEDPLLRRLSISSDREIEGSFNQVALQEENDRLSRSLNAAETKIQQLEQKLMVQIEKSGFENDGGVLNEEVTRLRGLINEKTNESNHLRSELRSLQTQFEIAFGNEEEGFLRKLKGKDEVLSFLLNEKNGLEEEVATLRAEADGVKTSFYKDREGLLKDLEKTRQTVEATQQDIEAIQKDADQLLQEKTQVAAELRDVKQKNEEALCQITQFRDLMRGLVMRGSQSAAQGPVSMETLQDELKKLMALLVPAIQKGEQD
ncbi:MAG: hypothetical protein WCG42_07410, partial [Parachlamydiaceae bacterium]